MFVMNYRIISERLEERERITRRDNCRAKISLKTISLIIKYLRIESCCYKFVVVVLYFDVSMKESTLE